MGMSLDASLPNIVIEPLPLDGHYFEVTRLLPPRRKYLLDAITQSIKQCNEVQEALKCFITLAPKLFALPLPPQINMDASSHNEEPILTFKAFAKRVRDFIKKSETSTGKDSEFLEEEHSALFYHKPFEYPPHWSIPSGDRLEEMKEDIKERTSNGVDLGSIAIYTTTKLLPGMDPKDSFGIIPPTSVEVKANNFALYFLDGDNGMRCDMLLLGGVPYALDSDKTKSVNSERERRKIEGKKITRDAVLHEYDANQKARTLVTNMPNRVGKDKKNPQDMVVFGERSAQQVNSYGHHSGLHSKGGKVLLAQEALGSGIIAGVQEYFIQPLLAGQLLMLTKESVDYGACIFPSLPPWTLGAVTKNYCNESHKDSGDLVGSCIVWLHAGVGTLSGGDFVCSSHGCHFKPKDGHVLYLCTPALFHHSSPPITTGSRCLLGVGLAASKHVITTLKDELIKTLEGKAAPLMTREENIPEGMLTPVISKFLKILTFTSKNKKRKL